ncbi:MAG: hypothetical protein WBD20_26505 [Pirellulaceae bacterium]
MNDVRRALFFWPAFTSTLIILISLISPFESGNWRSVASRFEAEWAKFQHSGELETAAPPSEQLAISADDLQRDANELYAATQIPSRDVQPLTVETVNDIVASLSELSQDLFNGDMTAANRIAGEETSTDHSLGMNLLRQIPFQTQASGDTTPQMGLESPANQLDQLPLEQSIASATPGIVTQEIPVAVEPLDDIDSKKADLNADVIPQPPTPRESVMPKSIANLAKVVPRNTEEPTEQFDESDDQIGIEAHQSERERLDTVARSALSGNPSTWPVTPKLNEQLQRLSQATASDSASSVVITDWAAQVQSRLDTLRTMPRLGEPEAIELIRDLDTLSRQALVQAEEVPQRQAQIRWLQAAYAVNRRVTVWAPVWSVVSNANQFQHNELSADNGNQVLALVEQVQSDIVATGDASGWSDYLMLLEIIKAASGDHIDQRSFIAQRVLSRIEWHGLDTVQQQWLDRSSVKQLVVALQPWTSKPVDYAALLNQVERQESDAIDLAGIEIASTTQTLRFSGNAGAVQVADAIDSCYRNANIRTAISQDMLRRLVPDVPQTSVNVRTNMLGSRVSGISHINSQLDLQLQPANDRWSFTLETEGNVRTHSIGRKGQSLVRTRGDSGFVAATPVEISPAGVNLGDSEIDVQGNTRLRDVVSQYDNWPLLGSLARNMIAAKYHERSSITSRIANRRMKDQIADGIDERLELKVEKATTQLNDVVMGPFNSLRLQPEVVDMQTTDQRLIARYRLAGDWQVGASTPRPRAPSDSLISVQINQSAFNNTLERVVPLGEPITLQAALDNTMEIFGRPKTKLPEDIPTDVSIQFTKNRPITVEMEDGILWITMRVVELSRAKGGELNRFIVRAGYRAEVDGLQAKLVREGHLSISGPGMSMRQRLPIRAIFNKVFSPNNSIPLTNETFVSSESLADAEISQLEIRDGWLALAVSSARPDRIAVGQSNKQ